VEWDEVRFDVRLMQRVPVSLAIIRTFSDKHDQTKNGSLQQKRRIALSVDFLKRDSVVHRSDSCSFATTPNLMNDEERWAKVPDMDDSLWVSSIGRIWQYNKQRRKWTPPKTPTVLRHGYPTTTHNQRIYRVHYLMAIAFIGPQPSPQHTVDHIAKYDGDWQRERSDNRIENLRWATRKEQRQHQSASAPRIDRRTATAAVDIPEDEEFREVEGILVSQYGRTRNFYGVEYKPVPNKSMEYALVGTQRRPVHVLLALAFPDLVTPPTEGQNTVDHIDRDKANNVATNLRWATGTEQQENTVRPHADDISNHKEPVDVCPPGSSDWITYSSCSSASRGIQKTHGRRISPQSMAQFIKSHPNGGTIRLRQNAGWSFRPGQSS
jgi:hypothetical protein